MAVVRDVSEQYETQAALRRKKLLGDTLIDHLPGVFYLFEDAGRYLRWNKNLEALSGYSSAEITAMSPLNFIAEADRKTVAERIAEVFDAGSASVEARLLTKDGREIPHLFTGGRVVLDGKPHLTGMGVDISKRKAVETALQATKEQLDYLVNEAPVALYTCAADGDFATSYMSDSVKALTGFAAERFIADPYF
jgi:PAS domain S-box-containing protein